MKKTISFFLLLSVSISSIFGQSNDLLTIKKRIIDELLSNSTSDNQVNSILSKMKEDGSFPDINYSDLSNIASFPHGRHTSDLAYLARAYKNKTSTFYSDKKVKEIREKENLQH